MKKLLLIGLLACYTQAGAHAQATEIIQLGLNVQKLAQLRSILNNLRRGYQIVSRGYNTVKNISEGNFNLHKTFLDGLMDVSPAVRNYRRVPEIVNYQVALVREYQAAFRRFSRGGWFNPEELEYMAGVYDRLFKSSLKNLDELILIISSGKTRMSDDERLAAIDRIHADLEDKVTFLREFNSSASVLAVQRAKAQNDVEGLKVMFDIKTERQ